VNAGGFLLVVLVLGAIWFFVVVPSRRRQRSHAEMQDSVEVGDDVITAGGLHAVVLEEDGDELRVEIAPGVVVTLDRRAVAAVAREIEVEVEVEDEVEPEDDPKGGSDAPLQPS
jgi:preprotein translocase subunit YajC